LHTRVEESIYGPMELRVLAKSFNHMVTGLEQREAGLLAAKDVAESANRSKSEFLANISHELRTPLNAVIGFSDLMRNEIHGPLGSEKYNDYLNDIHGSGSHLLDIINDVLDMSKAEAGRMDIDEEEFDLGAALQACTRMVSERAAVGGIQVECLTPDDLPNLFADGRLVRQIVLNLLTNAIKFTGDGGEVVLEALVDDAGACRISVADTGIGIAPEFLDSIMQPFVQVDSGMDRKYEGTGLGLSLVKSMAELHNATVEIESTPGIGTTIFVRFPAERVRA
jgi:signal transduction histidine kinase